MEASYWTSLSAKHFHFTCVWTLLVSKQLLKSVSQFHVIMLIICSLVSRPSPPAFVAYNKHRQATLKGKYLHH